MRIRRTASFAFVALLALTAISPNPAVADDPYPTGVAPLYLIVSFDDTFVTGVHASETVVVNVGTLVGGDGMLDTRFAVDTALTSIPLPDGRHAPTFDELQTNASTLLGSFMTSDLGEIHMVTPAPGEIPPEIQVAVFEATHFGHLDALLVSEPFPTTTDIADVIVDSLPPGSTYDRSSVLSAVFGSAPTLNVGSDGSAEGNGEMFPHAPNSEGLFHYSVKFFSDGAFESDIALRVGFDIHPDSKTNPVNFKSKNGQMPAVIISANGFSATEVVASSVNIGGVAPNTTKLRDMDSDGDLDLWCQWSVLDLVNGGAASSATKSLDVRADLQDGTSIIGTSPVNVK